MGEYKIIAYITQRLDNKTLLPKGKKQTRYCVCEKKFPFPNKSIFIWETVKDGFKTEKKAKEFLKTLEKGN